MTTSVCISVPLWQIRIFGVSLSEFLCRSIWAPIYCLAIVSDTGAWCTCKRADLLACVPYQRRRASTSVDESEARCATDVYGRRRARCEWALRHYIREVNDSIALEFWQEDGHYLLLSKMARIYSGISPDSVPVKSLFSCAGFMLNSRRSVTSPYKADTVTFVHDNYDDDVVMYA